MARVVWREPPQKKSRGEQSVMEADVVAGGIEAKSQHDGAWYDAEVEVISGNVSVRFTLFPLELECWSVGYLAGLENINQVIRWTSTQLQDENCGSVRVDARVCATKDRGQDRDLKYYDAVINQVVRQDHVFENGEECCKCQFYAIWECGPDEGQEVELGCADICLLSEKNIDTHLVVRNVLGLVGAHARRVRCVDCNQKSRGFEEKERGCRVVSSAKGKAGEPFDASVMRVSSDLPPGSLDPPGKTFSNKASSQCTVPTSDTVSGCKLADKPSSEVIFEQFPSFKSARTSSSSEHSVRAKSQATTECMVESISASTSCSPGFVNHASKSSSTLELRRGSAVNEEEVVFKPAIVKPMRGSIPWKEGDGFQLGLGGTGRREQKLDASINWSKAAVGAEQAHPDQVKKMSNAVDSTLTGTGFTRENLVHVDSNINQTQNLPGPVTSLRETISDFPPNDCRWRDFCSSSQQSTEPLPYLSPKRDSSISVPEIVCLSDDEDLCPVQPGAPEPSRSNLMSQCAVELEDATKSPATESTSRASTNDSCGGLRSEKEEWQTCSLPTGFLRKSRNSLLRHLRDSGCVLRIENVELDVDPSDILEMLHNIFKKDAVGSVHVPPPYPGANCGVAYAVFMNKAAANSALAFFKVCFVVSNWGRPWAVTRESQKIDENIVGFPTSSAFMGEGRAASKHISEISNGKLRVVTEMRKGNPDPDYNAAKRLAELFEHHNRQIRLLFQRMGEEEEMIKADPTLTLYH